MASQAQVDIAPSIASPETRARWQNVSKREKNFPFSLEGAVILAYWRYRSYVVSLVARLGSLDFTAIRIFGFASLWFRMDMYASDGKRDHGLFHVLDSPVPMELSFSCINTRRDGYV